MRKFLASLLLVAALGSVVACAKVNTNGTTATSTLTASEAITQAAGCATAIANLTTTSSPLDADTKAQVANWNAWAQFALTAAGIVAKDAGI